MTIVRLTPTDEFFWVEDAVKVRVWEGTTEAGVRCRLLVAGVELPDGASCAEFDAEFGGDTFVIGGPDPDGPRRN